MAEEASVELPAVMHARVERAEASRIPRVIHQTFRSRRVPGAMASAVGTWISMNPDYEYRLFDDADIHALAAGFDCSDLPFDRDALCRALHTIRPGAGRADLFRYLLLYERGGVYMDIDTVCLAPLSRFVHPADDVVSGVGLRGDFHQWGLIYSPRHPFMKRALENAVSNVLRRTFVAGFENTLEGLCGPPCLDLSIKQVLGIPAQARFRPGFYEFPIDGRVHRIRLLEGDLFGGQVAFKYDGYLEDLAQLGLRHWIEEALFDDSADGPR